MEKTLLLIKPDGVEKHIIGEVLSRFERKGLKIAALKLIRATRQQAEVHYADLKKKPFFGELLDYMTRSPIIAAVIAGEDAVAAVRQLNGATNPLEAVPGSIRGDYGIYIGENIVHGSDSLENAEREINNFFKPEEILL
ncbi:MAG: nucleoside-diphosphate kinase [Acidaminococcaceae bacterium]|nr:nucleoside-diphosphate kinase [Acidaminococcaceae bacterium]